VLLLKDLFKTGHGPQYLHAFHAVRFCTGGEQRQRRVSTASLLLLGSSSLSLLLEKVPGKRTAFQDYTSAGQESFWYQRNLHTL